MYEYEQYEQKCTYSCYNRTKETNMRIKLFPFGEWVNDLTVEEEEATKAISKGLRTIRKWREYTLKETEAATNIPHPTISRYETGENVPSIIQMFKLCTFYKIDINSILVVGLMNETQTENFLEKIESEEKKVKKLLNEVEKKQK